MANNATRVDKNEARIEHEGQVIKNIANKPLVPDELVKDDRLDIVGGFADLDDVDLPDDLRESLDSHGYLPNK